MKVDIQIPTRLYFPDYHYGYTVESVLDSLGLSNELEVIELEELEGADYVFEIRRKDGKD